MASLECPAILMTATDCNSVDHHGAARLCHRRGCRVNNAHLFHTAERIGAVRVRRREPSTEANVKCCCAMDYSRTRARCTAWRRPDFGDSVTFHIGHTLRYAAAPCPRLARADSDHGLGSPKKCSSRADDPREPFQCLTSTLKPSGSGTQRRRKWKLWID